MDFGDILDAWEKNQKLEEQSSGSSVDMDRLLAHYPPKDVEDRDRRDNSMPRHKVQSMKPQAVLDLHGMSSLEAEQALEQFVNTAWRKGLRRVLIVHGKGNHSRGEPVLLGVVRRYLEKCPTAGSFGPAERKKGGRGATWVVLRAR